MVRKAGKLQRLFARMFIDRISLFTWYAKVHNFRGVTLQTQLAEVLVFQLSLSKMSENSSDSDSVIDVDDNELLLGDEEISDAFLEALEALEENSNTQ